MFNKAWSTNGNARKRKWWMRVKFCDWYKSCNDIFIILYLYMNTTLEWLYTTSSCMSIRYGWSRGIFNKARSTNWNTNKRKWWMRVKICDWCKSYNDIFMLLYFLYEYNIRMVRPHFILHVDTVWLKSWNVYWSMEHKLMCKTT